MRPPATAHTRESRRVRVLIAALVIAVGAFAIALAVFAAPKASAGTISIDILSNSFSPASATINVGDTVTWTNTDSNIHTTTSNTGLWDSGIMAAGATFSHTFTEAGTYQYECTIHGFVGTVVVNAASTTSTSSTTSTTAPGAQTFVDVPPSNAYFAAIEALAGDGIINGYDIAGGAKEFRPASDVLRAQFAKMIVGALGITVVANAPIPFTDVPRDASGYPADYVAAAYDHNITQGRTATSFAPFVPVLRAQVTTLVVRALQQLHPNVLADPPAAYQSTWGISFSSIHGPLARIAEFNGLLDGIPLATSSANPLAPMSRGEVARVLWNMMNRIGL